MKWIIFLLVLLVTACEYNPKGSHYVDLNQETYGNIAIDLLNQPDTIFLIQESNYSYNIVLEQGQVIHSTEISVNGEVITTTGSSQGTYRLYPNDYETGLHLLKIEVMTNSGTGSISDLAGAELYYTREWVVIVDHTPPESIEITNIYESNGKLRIEWTKNYNRNFQHYIVYKTLINPINNLSNETATIIYNADSNWFVDDTYVGGQVTYHIQNTGMNISVQGIPKSYNGTYPEILSVEKTNGDRLKFTWSKTRFPGNFGKYELASRDKLNYTFTTLFTSENPNDTSYTHTLDFGDSVDIWLNTIPEKVSHWYPETMSDRTTVYAGEKIPRHYSGLVHSNDPDIVYLVDYYSISRYNLKTGISELTLETNYNDWEHRNTFISPDGKSLVRISGNTVYQLDPVNLTTIRSINLSALFNNSNSIRLVAVTNNGWLSVSKDNFPYMSGLVNLATSDTVFTVKGLGYMSIYPSASCKYMIISTGLNSALYHYNGVRTKLHDLGSNIFEFNSVNEEELYKFSPTDNSISILNCSDLNVIKSYIPFMAVGSNDIDPISGLVMINGQYKMYILDLDRKIVAHTRNIAFSSYYWLDYHFFNNTLFSRYGYKLTLNQ